MRVMVDTVLIIIGLLCVYECTATCSSWVQTELIVMWLRRKC